MKTWQKLVLAGVGLFSVGAIIGKVLASPNGAPSDHVALINRTKIYYPQAGVTLKPQFLFLGHESPAPDQPQYPQSVWAWLWDDGLNVDTACILVISDRITTYDLEFARMDAPGLEEVTVVFDNTSYPNFWSTIATTPGYGGLQIAK